MASFYLGVVCLAVAFAIVATLVVYSIGVLGAVLTFGFAIGVTSLIYAGIHLING